VLIGQPADHVERCGPVAVDEDHRLVERGPVFDREVGRRLEQVDRLAPSAASSRAAVFIESPSAVY
jgi:hypothetical protein